MLLVRAWLHDGQLVARLQSSQTGEDGQRAEVAVGIEGIEMTVSRWLRDVAETPR